MIYQNFEYRNIFQPLYRIRNKIIFIVLYGKLL